MNWIARMQPLHTPWVGWWLVCALVLAPALGRMHQVLHAPQLWEHASVHHAEPAHDHGLADLFGAHAASDCLALDQLTHGGDAPTPILWQAHIFGASPLPWHLEPTALPAVAALFQARAPPRVYAALSSS